MKKIVTLREGFSLVELLIALVITAVIGAAMTALFVTQAKFLEVQQKQEFARGVSRSATNIIMSELRMLDRDSGVAAAYDTSLTLRVPYAVGLVCAAAAGSGGIALSLFPLDTSVYNMSSTHTAGYAYRKPDETFKYLAQTGTPAIGGATACTSANIATMSTQGGFARTVNGVTGSLPSVGMVVMLYHTVRYHFSASTAVTGRRGLYRDADGTDEEIVAPFDTTAKFNFYTNDAMTSTASPPSTLRTLTGIDLILNSISERPNQDGTYTVVPLRTAVFFKNRRT